MEQQDVKALRELCKKMGITGTSIEDGHLFNSRNAALFGIVSMKITPQQFVALTKAAQFGWQMTKVYWHNTNGTCAMVIATNENVAIVYPDGKMDRAPHNKRTVRLDPKVWDEAASNL